MKRLHHTNIGHFLWFPPRSSHRYFNLTKQTTKMNCGTSSVAQIYVTSITLAPFCSQHTWFVSISFTLFVVQLNFNQTKKSLIFCRTVDTEESAIRFCAHFLINRIVMSASELHSRSIYVYFFFFDFLLWRPRMIVLHGNWEVATWHLVLDLLECCPIGFFHFYYFVVVVVLWNYHITFIINYGSHRWR